jgi:hypothetical protein
MLASFGHRKDGGRSETTSTRCARDSGSGSRTPRAEYAPEQNGIDQAWLDYQHEIGLRHHRLKKGRTGHAPTTYIVPLP